MRNAGIADITVMAINGHLDERMHKTYSGVSAREMQNAVAKDIELNAFRTALERPDALRRQVPG